MQVKVLIGFAEALAAPEVVWSLADAGFEVHAFARRGGRAALRYSRYVTVASVTPPEADAEATVREVSALARSLSRGSRDDTVLFPLDDAAVWTCDRVVEAVRLAGPSGRQLPLALDKTVQIETARRAGFNVLPTRLVRTSDEVLDIDNEFPLVLKPSQAVDWVEGSLRKGRVWICGNRQELERAVKRWTDGCPRLLQPYVRGTGEGVFGLSRGTKVEALSAHRRVRMMNPHGSGSSACVSQPVSAELSGAAEKLIQLSEWRGLFMIEMLRDAQGTAWFMDFNGRPWGSLALARRQGLEYPAWNVRLTLDGACRMVDSSRPQPGLVCRHLGRELMHPLFVLKGPTSSAVTEWPSLWRCLSDLLDFRGTQALYNWRRDDKRVFFADCANTLLDNLLKAR